MDCVTEFIRELNDEVACDNAKNGELAAIANFRSAMERLKRQVCEDIATMEALDTHLEVVMSALADDPTLAVEIVRVVPEIARKLPDELADRMARTGRREVRLDNLCAYKFDDDEEDRQ